MELTVNKKVTKALLKITGDRDIACVEDAYTGEEIYHSPFNFLRYTLSHARINADNTLNIYMRDLSRLWKLVGIYIGVVVIALTI